MRNREMKQIYHKRTHTFLESRAHYRFEDVYIKDVYLEDDGSDSLLILSYIVVLPQFSSGCMVTAAKHSSTWRV